MSKYGVFSGPNAGKYGLEKTPIWTLFMECDAVWRYKNLLHLFNKCPESMENRTKPPNEKLITMVKSDWL